MEGEIEVETRYQGVEEQRGAIDEESRSSIDGRREAIDVRGWRGDRRERGDASMRGRHLRGDRERACISQ